MSQAIETLQLGLEAEGVGIPTEIDYKVSDFDVVAGAVDVGEYIKKRMFTVSGYTFAVAVFPNENVKRSQSSVELDDGWIRIGIMREDNQDGVVYGRVSVEAMFRDRLPPQPSFISWESRSVRLMPARDIVAEAGEGFALGWLAHLHDLRRLGYLADGTLRFRVKFCPKLPNLPQHLSVPGPCTRCESLASDFHNLLDSQVASDVKLVAEYHEFPCHWAVLSCRSPVFQNMFQSQLSGDREKIIIADMDRESLALFLQFLYTGTVKLIGNTNNPVGEWHYGQTLESCFTITESEGKLKYHEKRSGGICIDAILDSGGGPMHWSGTCSNGAVISLRLVDGRMHGEYTSQHLQDVSLVKARCLQAEEQTLHMWGDLMRAADKYCVTELCKLGEQQMLALMDETNAATILRISSETGQDRLKMLTLKFITASADRMRDVQGTRAFDELGRELVSEISESFFGPPRKRVRVAQDMEFPSGQDWEHLSNAQLRRACRERDLSTSGNRTNLLALLSAQEQFPSID